MTDPLPCRDSYLSLMTTPVDSLVTRPPVILGPDATVQDAARTMREHGISSVMVTRGDQVLGLVTDRDLRNRVVAEGLDVGRPVLDVATRDLLTVAAHAPAFDAMLLMARHNIHHVPVMEGSRLRGIITSSDVTKKQSQSAVYLAGDIYKQTTVDGLVGVSAHIKALQQTLADSEASAYATGHIVTTITDALTTRLLQLGEAQLGTAPVPYAWVAAGSQARNEQTAKSDQDNCLVLSDDYDEAAHGAYFKALTTFVCDGLDACGYVHCPGDMMAMNDRWRQTLAAWKVDFHHWIHQPDPTALMLTGVFFDQRFVAGHEPLMAELRQEVQRMAKGQRIFLAHMVGNALTHQPPLGLLGGINLIRQGEHKGKIDLKMNGIVPVIDLARVYALASGHDAINTYDRLLRAADGGEISEQSAHDLRDALAYLAGLRIRHQARRMHDGYAADNFLALEELSNFERQHLKDAFNVVKTLQSVLQNRYGRG